MIFSRSTTQLLRHFVVNIKMTPTPNFIALSQVRFFPQNDAWRCIVSWPLPKKMGPIECSLLFGQSPPKKNLPIRSKHQKPQKKNWAKLRTQSSPSGHAEADVMLWQAISQYLLVLFFFCSFPDHPNFEDHPRIRNSLATMVIVSPQLLGL